MTLLPMHPPPPSRTRRRPHRQAAGRAHAGSRHLHGGGRVRWLRHLGDAGAAVERRRSARHRHGRHQPQDGPAPGRRRHRGNPGARRRPRRSRTGADAAGRPGNQLRRDPAGRPAPRLCRPGSETAGRARRAGPPDLPARSGSPARRSATWTRSWPGRNASSRAAAPRCRAASTVTRQRIAQYDAQIRAFEAQLASGARPVGPDPGGTGGCPGTGRQGPGTQAAPAGAQAPGRRPGRRTGRVRQPHGAGA